MLSIRIHHVAAVLSAMLGLCLRFATTSVTAGATEWADLRVTNGQLRITTSINGIPGYSIIDTGAQINAINERFIRANDLDFRAAGNIKISGINTTETRRRLRSVPVAMFGAEFSSWTTPTSACA